MGIQFIGQVKYAPSRDLLYIYPDVLRNVADRLEDAPFKPLHDWLKERDVTLDDLGEAAGCYCKYMNAAHQGVERTMWDILEKSGWNQCKWEARVAYMFYVGILMTGVFFKGVRDATPEGGETISQVKALIAAGRQFDAYLSLSWFEKWLYRRFKWLRRLLMRTHGIYTEV